MSVSPPTDHSSPQSIATCYHYDISRAKSMADKIYGGYFDNSAKRSEAELLVQTMQKADLNAQQHLCSPKWIASTPNAQYFIRQWCKCQRHAANAEILAREMLIETEDPRRAFPGNPRYVFPENIYVKMPKIQKELELAEQCAQDIKSKL